MTTTIDAYEEALEAALPADLPERAGLVWHCARHLALLSEVNEHMNLSRILEPKEAALKHVLDSVLPWKLLAKAQTVLDVGSGAGFPGIPLALMLPDATITLAESTRKKAGFLTRVVRELELENVVVRPERGEALLRVKPYDALVLRAVGSIEKVLPQFASVRDKLRRVYFYKGPNAEAEIAAAKPILRELRLQADVVFRYELPECVGSRCIVELKKSL